MTHPDLGADVPTLPEFLQSQEFHDLMEAFRSSRGMGGFVSTFTAVTDAIKRAALSELPPLVGQREAIANALGLYAESYDTMSHMGDGKVNASSVAFDIRRNLVDSAYQAVRLATPVAAAVAPQDAVSLLALKQWLIEKDWWNKLPMSWFNALDTAIQAPSVHPLPESTGTPMNSDVHSSSAFSPPAAALGHAEVAVKPLAWTINLPGDGTCRYDHCDAQTPFGRIRITWKGWKEYDCPTVDEAPWYECPDKTWLVGVDVADAQAQAEAEYRRRVLQCLNAAPKGQIAAAAGPEAGADEPQKAEARAVPQAPEPSADDQPGPTPGYPKTSRDYLEALLDLWDDENQNAPEHRCYVPGAFREEVEAVRKFLAAASPQAGRVEPSALADEEIVRLCEESGAELAYRSYEEDIKFGRLIEAEVTRRRAPVARAAKELLSSLRHFRHDHEWSPRTQAALIALDEAFAAPVVETGRDALAEPPWVARKALMESHDDGSEPWCLGEPEPHWAAFKAWATDHLGQGYSLACAEGHLLDPTTAWAFRGFQAGTALSGTAERMPLTEERLHEVLNECYRRLVLETGYNGGMGGLTWDKAAARAIERAHRIGIAPDGADGADSKQEF